METQTEQIPPETDDLDDSAKDHKKVRWIHRVFLFTGLFLAPVGILTVLYYTPVTITTKYPSGGKHTYHVKRYEYWFKDKKVKHGYQTLYDSNGNILYQVEMKGSWSSEQSMENANPSALPTYVEALKDDDFMIQCSALHSLALIGPPAKDAVPALIELLDDKDEIILGRVVFTLGCIGPGAKNAVTALIELLKDDNPHIRRDTARALGNIGPSAINAVPALQALADDTSQPEFVRNTAREAIQKINPAIPTPPTQ